MISNKIWINDWENILMADLIREKRHVPSSRMDLFILTRYSRFHGQFQNRNPRKNTQIELVATRCIYFLFLFCNLVEHWHLRHHTGTKLSVYFLRNWSTACSASVCVCVGLRHNDRNESVDHKNCLSSQPDRKVDPPATDMAITQTFLLLSQYHISRSPDSVCVFGSSFL